MDALELVVLLGTAIVVGGFLAHRLGVASPVVLLVLGALLGFAPTVREVHLPAELMLVVFLPALLYWEAITSSLREIRTNLRGVVLMSTVLVVLTAAAVAAVAHALGMDWAPAWVLGAALAPTDATAVGVFARLLPRRNLMVLQAESLANDGTALVLYGVAVGITVGEQDLTAGHVTGLLALAYVGGAAAGAVVAWIGLRVQRHLPDSVLANAIAIVVPFAAFLLADRIGGSGVLAVVVAGLIVSQIGPRTVDAMTRRLAEPFWSLGTYLLNGALFVLVGIEVQSAVRSLSSTDLRTAVVAAVLIWVAIVVVRIGFLFVAAYTIRGLDRRPSQRLRRMSHRARIVSGVAGIRGAVSLAAALAVPATVGSGAPFPGRELIVFVTAVVVALTLVVQGLALPSVVRWARFPEDTAVVRERHLAERVSARAALAALPQIAERLGIDSDVVRRTREEYTEHLRDLQAQAVTGEPDTPTERTLRHAEQYTALRLEVIACKRAALVELRDRGRIDDGVLRRLQSRLDIEELRLGSGDPVND